MELMEFLYRVMEELANAGVPIVFKGAMVLNLAIRGNNPSKVDSSLDVQISRQFGERKSAGFKIMNESGDKIASIDLSVRQNKFCRPYISYVNGISINGSSLSKMLSDKIYAISGESVCRRVKDVLDIYVMSFVTEIDAEELRRIWKETGREPGNFEAFRTRSDELQIAYEKMKGVENKPDFCDVYDRVNDVVNHFDTH